MFLCYSHFNNLQSLLFKTQVMFVYYTAIFGNCYDKQKDETPPITMSATFEPIARLLTAFKMGTGNEFLKSID